MSAEEIRAISNENNPAKIGIIISVIIIFAGLFPNLEFGNIKITFLDSILILLTGFCSLFFFMSIKFNMDETQEGGYIRTTISNRRSDLSQNCFNISIFLFVLAIIRLLMVILIPLFK